MLAIRVDGMRDLIAHTAVDVGATGEWLIEFTAWTCSTFGSIWSTWVFVECGARRRDLAA